MKQIPCIDSMRQHSPQRVRRERPYLNYMQALVARRNVRALGGEGIRSVCERKACRNLFSTTVQAPDAGAVYSRPNIDDNSCWCV